MSSTLDAAKEKEGKTRRAFKACAHCRSRKAKCDLGDLDNPHPPPCSRCRREGIDCVFLPSRRGGRVPFSKQLEKRKAQDEDATSGPVDGNYIGTSGAGVGNSAGAQERDESESSEETKPALAPASYTAPQLQPQLNIHAAIQIPVKTEHRLYPPVFPVGTTGTYTARSSELGSASTNSANMYYGSREEKRRRIEKGGFSPDSLVTANLRNPLDALDLLVMAADSGLQQQQQHNQNNEFGRASFERIMGSESAPSHTPPSFKTKREDACSGEMEEGEIDLVGLSRHPLIKKKVISVVRVKELVDLFFKNIHGIFPFIPISQMPKSLPQLALFASDESFLFTTIIVIASRYDKDNTVHCKAWNYLNKLICGLITGQSRNFTVGAIEGLLLLSEYLPLERDGMSSLHNDIDDSESESEEDSDIHAQENRMSWMLVGTAVRIGYMLRLDESGRTSSESLSAGEQVNLDRERVAWTYCYLFDRHISVRTGKAFWSRGPSVCFAGVSFLGDHHSKQGLASSNFPSLRIIPGVQDDWASVLQANVELTQFMASAKDVLYPSKLRTITLIRGGEYYKFLDEFMRGLATFRLTWEGKKWETFPTRETIWINFHYLRLYVFAFSFQAHVQRTQWSREASQKYFHPEILEGHMGERRNAPVFPATFLASPDAKFILEAIDSATSLLELATEKLYPGGALPYLPARSFMMFSYAGVFLLKALYVDAVCAATRATMIRLVKKVIMVLTASATDDKHLGVRYARLLSGLLRAFSSHKADMTVTRVPTPSGDVEAPPANNPTPLTGLNAEPEYLFNVDQNLVDLVNQYPDNLFGLGLGTGVDEGNGNGTSTATGLAEETFDLFLNENHPMDFWSSFGRVEGI